MVASGFEPENCHTFQHRAVLQVMSECYRRARDDNDFEPLRLVGELAIWFPQHAQQMDAALAQHLASVGFDKASGRCARRSAPTAKPSPAAVAAAAADQALLQPTFGRPLPTAGRHRSLPAAMSALAVRRLRPRPGRRGGLAFRPGLSKFSAVTQAAPLASRP